MKVNALLPIRWRKVWRDLWAQKAKTLLMIMSISLGVMGVGMIGQSQNTLLEGMKESYQASNPSHLSIYSEPFDRGIVQVVRQIPGVKAVEARKMVDVKARKGGEVTNIENKTDWQGLQLFAIDDLEQTNLDKIALKQGAWPPPYGEIFLEETALRYLGLTIGSRLTVMIDGKSVHSLRVAGTVRDPLRDSPYISGRSYGYMSIDTLDYLHVPRTYNVLSLKVERDENDRNHLNDMAVRVRDTLNTYGIHVFSLDIPPPGRHWAYDIVHSMAIILQGFGLLIIFSGSTLIINTLFATLMAQLRQIGVMKVIGADRSTLVRMYAGNVSLIGLASLVVGIPLGMGASAIITMKSIDLLNFDNSRYEISYGIITLQIIVGLLLPIAVALVPVLIGTSIPEREAIGGQTREAGFGKLWIERVLERIRSLPRPIILSVRNTFRRKFRLLLTLLTVSIGGTVVISVISVNASLQETVEDYLRYSNYDFRITLGSPQPMKEAEQLAMNVSGVDQVESWFHSTAIRMRPDGSRSLDWTVFGIPSGSTFIKPLISKGRWFHSGEDNAIVLNSYLLREEPDIKPGDQILLKIGSTEDYWHVVGFAVGPTEVAAYVNKRNLIKQLAIDDVATLMNVRTKATVRTTQTTIAAKVKDYLVSKGIDANSYTITEDVRDIQKNRYSILTIFLGLLSILLIVVAGLGLMGTMSLNVLERAREIGIMRSIGASDQAIWGIVIVEGMTIGLMSSLFSAVLAYPVSKLICHQVGLSLFQAPLTYRYPMESIFLWILTAAILSIISSIAPAWKASRMPIKDVLSAE